MLTNVHLKNLALIQEAEIDFQSGLNIMTGETGSGKSIIIGSINIALGDKANKGIIRTGCEWGLVELTFHTDRQDIHDMLKEMGIADNGPDIVVTRKITQDSTVSRINGEAASLASIRKLTQRLVDIHGQHDHQSLLNPVSQLDILDSFGRDKIAGPKGLVHTTYEDYRNLKKEFSSYDMDETALAKEISFLEFELKEIEDAGLSKGEDLKLEREYKEMSGYEKLSETLGAVIACISIDEGGAGADISKALALISGACVNDPQNEDLKVFKSVLTDLDSVSRDLNHDLSRYAAAHTFDRNRYHEISERLNVINRLKSKYGNTVDDILDYGIRIEEKLKNYKNYNESRNELQARMATCRSMLNRYAAELSEARKMTADILAPMIRQNLKDLNFLTAEFEIEFKKADKISDNGYDRVEFLISTNPGEKARPLAKVASGGELSRTMLAIKSSIAENDDMPTMIFDEIDTGISGKTAQKVAEKLDYLSRNHQIICITHLPQIAAMADTHFGIHKEVSDGSTISGIERLTKEREIEEVANLLGGARVTKAVLDNARELKEMAVKIKENR